MLAMLLFLTSLIPLSFFLGEGAISLLLLVLFLSMLGVNHGDLVAVNSGWIFGLDDLSYLLVMLSLWIFVLAFLMSFPIRSEGQFPMFKGFGLLLLLFLILSFATLDLMVFYIFFESSLAPILIIILGWGTQPESLQAGLYMFFYTVFGSIPLLLGLIYLYGDVGSLQFMYMNELRGSQSWILFFCLYISFFVKLPVFSVHMWLPKAHVEAPVFGSMLLAGVMLKLGGYGMMRVLYLFLEFLFLYGNLFLSFGLMSGLYGGLICLYQSDMKSLVAFSSISHMGLFLGGLFSMSSVGVTGAFLMLIAHGFSSSGLFSLVGMIYERAHSKSLILIRGWLAVSPSFGMMFFLLSVSNMAAPPFLNLVSEVYLSISMISKSFFTVIPLLLIFFLSAAYSLNLFSLVQHGVLKTSYFFNCNLKMIEFLVLWLHLLPLLLLVFLLDLFFF